MWHFDKNKQKSIFKMAFWLIFVFGFVGTLLFTKLPTQHPTPRRSYSSNFAVCFPNLAQTFEVLGGDNSLNKHQKNDAKSRAWQKQRGFVSNELNVGLMQLLNQYSNIKGEKPVL